MISAVDPTAWSCTASPRATDDVLLTAATNDGEPSKRDARVAAPLREWRQQIRLRSVFDIVEQYFIESAVRDVCRTAIGRLPRCQADAIGGHYLQQIPVRALASLRGKSPSTIYNTLARAERKLAAGDGFFLALYKLGAVRDEALAERYPDGRLPDGRRIVHIHRAA